MRDGAEYPNVPTLSPIGKLEFILSDACQDFEILLKLRGESGDRTGRNYELDWRSISRIQMAMAKSFLFKIVRCRRIYEHGAGKLGLDREKRNNFLASTKSVTDVRDVNEHGFDPTSGRGGKQSRPSAHIHNHNGMSIAIDETSIAFF